MIVNKLNSDDLDINEVELYSEMLANDDQKQKIISVQQKDQKKNDGLNLGKLSGIKDESNQKN